LETVFCNNKKTNRTTNADTRTLLHDGTVISSTHDAPTSINLRLAWPLFSSCRSDYLALLNAHFNAQQQGIAFMEAAYDRP